MPGTDLGIDGIEIVDQLGEGGQAAVWWARDVDHQRLVAVKVFNPDADRGLFDRERKANGLLSGHDHVVHLQRSGFTAESRPFLVMEYADGGSLADHSFGWEEAVELMLGVTKAVKAAHDKGVVHRDIKPQNILLFSTDDGGHRAKLADFGIASVPGTPGTTTLRGSPAFAPPELLGELRVTNELGDIYSLGATTYFALSGDIPPVAGAASIVQERAEGSPIRPIWEVVVTAMSYDPGQRFPSAEHFSDALSAAAEKVRTSADIDTKPDPWIEPEVTPEVVSKRSPLWKAPMQLDSTRNMVGLAGGLSTAGLVLTEILDPTFVPGILLVPVGYLAGLLVSHGLDQD